MKTKTSPHVWTVTIILAAGASLWFFWPQLSIVVFSALMAFLFYPLFVRLKRGKGKGVMAAVTTLIASFLVVLIPLAIILISAVGQLLAFADTVGHMTSSHQLSNIVGEAIDFYNAVMGPLTGRQGLTEQSLLDGVRTILPAIARSTAQILLGIMSTLPQLGLAFFIYMFVFVEFLLYGPSLVRRLKDISPFDQKVTKQYLDRTALMANAMVKGQLIIAAIISAISSALLIPLGYGHYFFIFFILFTILNFIPLGCGIVLVPLVIYSMLMGQFWLGAIILVLYYLSGNLDPVLRSRFIPKTITLSMGLTMVATFCGIAHFGILGVVYGPIVAILIVTTFDLYREVKTKGLDVHANN